MAGLLCSWGADPTVVGCKAIGMGNTMLHQAALRGDGEMIRLLVRAARRLGYPLALLRLSIASYRFM